MRWVAAAVQHFKGRGILWEMWNEPNSDFWPPHEDRDAYCKLALAVGKAIRGISPREYYVGPAATGNLWPFCEGCFKAGLLMDWLMVTIHPYRPDPPESVGTDYAALRRLIARYALPGKQICYAAGEWGYNSLDCKGDEQQGKLLPRMYLCNLFYGAALTIWYDWHDDGSDPNNREQHFGTVSYAYHPHRDPVYDPKPAYLAVKTLVQQLRGFRVNKRLLLRNPDDYLLLLTRGAEIRLVAWTTDAAHAVTIPASPGRFSVTGYTGALRPTLTAGWTGLALSLDDSPQYLAPVTTNALLRVAAAWESAPQEMDISLLTAYPAITLTVKNPLSTPIRVSAAAQGKTLLLPPGAAGTLRFPLTSPRAECAPHMVTCNIAGIGRLSQALFVRMRYPPHLAPSQALHTRIPGVH